MSIEHQIREINEQRLRTWNRGKELLNRAMGEGRGMTAEESFNYDRLSDDITRLDRERDELLSSSEAKREYENITEEFRRVSTPDDRRSESRSESRMMDFFRRGSSTDTIDIDLTHCSAG